MRLRIINFLKMHPFFVNLAWDCARLVLTVWSWFLPIKEKTMIFSSFGGRKFDDSPKAIYDEVCKRPEFADWKLIWAFVDPEQHEIPRGEKVKIDTPAFFRTLLTSRVWVGNSVIDRGIKLKRKGVVRVETWHGAPLKKIGGEENQNSIGGKKNDISKGKVDKETIRCAQSRFDREIFQRIFHAAEDAFLLCDLPRNDVLTRYSQQEVADIRKRLNIPTGKKVLLYMPTYREYLVNENRETYLAPPMDLKKWEMQLGDKFVLLMRAHYAVSAALGMQENEFVRDVSAYPILNDLYTVADGMISDYSSAFFDYGILERPMFCFAYDLEEYEKKRGLYLSLEEALPCPVCRDEDALLAQLARWECDSKKLEAFRLRFVPYAGHACEAVIEKLKERLTI